MPVFMFEIAETVIYTTTVEAETRAEARKILERLIDSDDVDLVEKDSTALEISWPPEDDE